MNLSEYLSQRKRDATNLGALYVSVPLYKTDEIINAVKQSEANNSEAMKEDATIDKIINALDEYARNYDHYEYGLPSGNDKRDNEMRDIVRNILIPNQ